MKSHLEIKAVLANIDAYQNQYPGMTYEQGVEEALMWVIDEIPDDEFGYSSFHNTQEQN